MPLLWARELLRWLSAYHWAVWTLAFEKEDTMKKLVSHKFYHTKNSLCYSWTWDHTISQSVGFQWQNEPKIRTEKFSLLQRLHIVIMKESCQLFTHNSHLIVNLIWWRSPVSDNVDSVYSLCGSNLYYSLPDSTVGCILDHRITCKDSRLKETVTWWLRLLQRMPCF